MSWPPKAGYDKTPTIFAFGKRACKSKVMTSDAEKELCRIERELDAKQQPPEKLPVKQGGWVGSHGEKPKNQPFDAVVVGALLLLGIGATFVI